MPAAAPKSCGESRLPPSNPPPARSIFSRLVEAVSSCFGARRRPAETLSPEVSTRSDSQPTSTLQRFHDAQRSSYPQALAELKAGEKRGHWIWYVFPQLKGIGTSPQSELYGIASLEEAREYLADPVLGTRLRECVQAVSAHAGKRTITQILGSEVDVLKLKSSLTLFHYASGTADSDFHRALRQFFGGEEDPLTLAMLSG